MFSKNLRKVIRTKLQNRYGVHSTDLRIKLFDEQMYYGHREVFTKYLDLPKDAYFEALIPHGKIFPHEMDPLVNVKDQDGDFIKQLHWRSDSETRANELGLSEIFSIGSPILYAFHNIGYRLDDCKAGILHFAQNHNWSRNSHDLLDLFKNKKILYMPLHSWEGDVVSHNLEKVDFLRGLDPTLVKVSLAFLDYCDPSVRRIYASAGWGIDCAGVRESMGFGSPAGGRVNYLYEMTKILDWADVVISDELSTGQLYAACLGKEVGLLPGSPASQLIYSKWRDTELLNSWNTDIRLLFPWLTNNESTAEKIYNDVSIALGIETFRKVEELTNLMPWRRLPSLIW